MSGSSILPLGGCTLEQFQEVTEVMKGDATAAAALCKIFTSRDRTEEVAYGLNTLFLLSSGALVFIMHGGFAMLEAGAIRSKNAMNILLQTVLDGAASAIMWYLVGYGFAYGEGDSPNGFIGDALFGLARYTSHPSPGAGWTSWFFQWAFCATAATIPAGAVAERFNFNAYLGYSLFLGGLVYPVVAHWAWCPSGWLGYGNRAPLLGAGMIDFAGSGVVHMVGGLAGLIGAWMVGPRLGRFDADGRPVPMPGHSAILVVLGTVLLWFGWYGFNPGSALFLDTRASALLAGRAAVTTTLAGAAGGLSCLVLGWARSVAWDLISLCNGMLCGFVAVTAGAAVFEPWAAIIAGVVAGCLFEAMCVVLLKLKIDDVVSAGPMHGFCGMWGVLLVGLLAKKEYVEQLFPAREEHPYGLFYGGGGKLLASQVIGVLAIVGWVAGTMGPFFALFRFAGALRISAEEEHTGLDVSKHGGSAYHMAAWGHDRHGGHGGAAAAAGGTLALRKAAAGDAIMRGNTMGFQTVVGGSSHHTSHHLNFHHHAHSNHTNPSNGYGSLFAQVAAAAAGSPASPTAGAEAAAAAEAAALATGGSHDIPPAAITIAYSSAPPPAGSPTGGAAAGGAIAMVAMGSSGDAADSADGGSGAVTAVVAAPPPPQPESSCHDGAAALSHEGVVLSGSNAGLSSGQLASVKLPLPPVAEGRHSGRSEGEQAAVRRIPTGRNIRAAPAEGFPEEGAGAQ